MLALVLALALALAPPPTLPLVRQHALIGVSSHAVVVIAFTVACVWCSCCITGLLQGIVRDSERHARCCSG